MPDFSAYPEDFSPYLSELSDGISSLMDDLSSGRITLAEWRDKFADLLATYMAASYLLGSGVNPLAGMIGVDGQPVGGLSSDAEGTLLGAGAALLVGWLAGQLDFLNGFHDTIQTGLASRTGSWSQWSSRAQQYTYSLVTPYYTGATEGLPLPAMPGDMSSECGELCACDWRIDWIDQEKGDADCYWLLNQTRVVPAERHCQQCLERSAQWNPLQVRGWSLQIPESEVSLNGGVQP